MAREASALTKAIRKLCDESGGKITHGEARPKLKKMGFEIVADPGEKTDDLRRWEEVAEKYKKPSADDKDAVKSFIDTVAKESGLSRQATSKVLAEIEARRLFTNERNNFDVTKYNWTKLRESGKSGPSRKPAAATTEKGRVAAKTGRRAVQTVTVSPKPKHGRRPVRVAVPSANGDGNHDYADAAAALKRVEERGGVSVVQQKVAEYRKQATEIEEMERDLELVALLAKAVSAA